MTSQSNGQPKVSLVLCKNGVQRLRIKQVTLLAAGYQHVMWLNHQGGASVAQVVLNIELTVDIPNKPGGAILHDVKNSHGRDITKEFKSYGAQKNCELTKLANIETCAEEFAKDPANASLL